MTALSFLNGFKKGMFAFSYNIAITVNSILLMAVYITGVGVTSLFAKIAKKHFLEKKIDRNIKTYWADLNLKKKPLEDYYRQF